MTLNTNDEMYNYLEINEKVEKQLEKKKKIIPKAGKKEKLIKVPEIIYQCSGINIMGIRIKSFIFTTDVAIINNNNAGATFGVYPFKPQISVMDSVIEASSAPAFVGVGGRNTTAAKSVYMAINAESKGAFGVVLNSLTKLDVIRAVAEAVNIVVVCTVASEYDDYLAKVKAGADIIQVSGAKNTPEIIKNIRRDLGPEFPIIATGGPNDETILQTILAGANAIIYTPPTSAELFSENMAKYREESKLNYEAKMKEEK